MAKGKPAGLTQGIAEDIFGEPEDNLDMPEAEGDPTDNPDEEERLKKKLARKKKLLLAMKNWE